MANLELSYRSAADLARMIRTRRISPVEVVQSSLDRIAEINPTLNAFCFIYGEEALKKARDLLPDLIVLDLMIPAVDGLEVCKILRRDARTATIPIVMLTAKAA